MDVKNIIFHLETNYGSMLKVIFYIWMGSDGTTNLEKISYILVGRLVQFGMRRMIKASRLEHL